MQNLTPPQIFENKDRNYRSLGQKVQDGLYEFKNVKFMYTYLFSASLLFLLVFFNSCKDSTIDQLVIESTDSVKTYTPSDDGMMHTGPIVLGKKLQGEPYSVQNMKMAYQSLVEQATSNSEKATIQTTHRYVRFHPKSLEELDSLLSYHQFDFFDYPMDYEIESDGQYYHDPSIPEDEITYYYALIPTEETIPSVEHIVLQNLFLPYAEKDKNSRIASFSEPFLEALETRSLFLTGNIDEESNKNARLRNWFPQGRIEYEEFVGSSGRTLPLKGIRVTAKRHFKVERMYTNENGDYFSTKKFSRKVTFNVRFQNQSQFKIAQWGGTDQLYNGPTQDSHWNLNIRHSTDPSKSWFAANVYAAGQEFAENYQTWGIRNPFGWSTNLLNIRVRYSDGGGKMVAYDGNNITIWTYNPGNSPKDTDDLFSVTFHEIGHQSHWRNNYLMATYKKIIRESWADCVRWWTLPLYYPNHFRVRNTTSLPTDGNSRFKSFQQSRSQYTALFIDLIDDENQLAIFGGDRPDDVINHFSFAEVQNMAAQRWNVARVKDYIEDNYSSRIDDIGQAEFDAFFEWYQRIEDNPNP